VSVYKIIDHQAHERRKSTVYGAGLLIAAFLLVVLLGFAFREAWWG
jgi:hypothetical protein